MGGSSSSAVRLGAARARSSVPSWPAPAPYLLVIEDAHWADEATLDLLRHLARRIHTCHALVLVTYRPEDLPAGHDLRRVMGEVATAAGVRAAPGPLPASTSPGEARTPTSNACTRSPEGTPYSS